MRDTAVGCWKCCTLPQDDVRVSERLAKQFVQEKAHSGLTRGRAETAETEQHEKDATTPGSADVRQPRATWNLDLDPGIYMFVEPAATNVQP